jgi:NAD(P)-dependent dehydrogenase (short-subunit alcohol dehydrogenase family)
MAVEKKVTLVIAGGSGMGAATARKLAADGYAVGVLSSSGKGEALAAELGGIGVTGSNQSSAVKTGGRARQHVGSDRHVSALRRIAAVPAYLAFLDPRLAPRPELERAGGRPYWSSASGASSHNAGSRLH